MEQNWHLNRADAGIMLIKGYIMKGHQGLSLYIYVNIKFKECPRFVVLPDSFDLYQAAH